MIKGTVARLVDGRYFGFINIEGKDYFFHRDDFNDDWRVLSKGDEVICEIIDSPKGPRVRNVSLVE